MFPKVSAFGGLGFSAQPVPQCRTGLAGFSAFQVQSMGPRSDAFLPQIRQGLGRGVRLWFDCDRSASHTVGVSQPLENRHIRRTQERADRYISIAATLAGGSGGRAGLGSTGVRVKQALGNSVGVRPSSE